MKRRKFLASLGIGTAITLAAPKLLLSKEKPVVKEPVAEPNTENIISSSDLNNTVLRFKVPDEIDPAGVAEMKLKYKKPNGEEGEYDISPEGDYQDITLKECGAWTFWMYIKFEDDVAAHGEPHKVMVNKDAIRLIQ